MYGLEKCTKFEPWQPRNLGRGGGVDGTKNIVGEGQVFPVPWGYDYQPIIIMGISSDEPNKIGKDLENYCVGIGKRGRKYKNGRYNWQVL